MEVGKARKSYVKKFAETIHKYSSREDSEIDIFSVALISNHVLTRDVRNFSNRGSIMEAKPQPVVPSLYSWTLPLPTMISKLKHQFIMHCDGDPGVIPFHCGFPPPRPKSTPNARQVHNPTPLTSLTATELKAQVLRVGRTHRPKHNYYLR